MISEQLIKCFVITLIALFFIIRYLFVRYYKKFKPKFLIKYLVALLLIILYLNSYLDFALVRINANLRYGGLIIIILGYILFFASHYYLKENWSTIFEKKTKKASLIKKGPYKYIRHPIYLACFITLIGFFMLSANWLLCGIPLIILVIFYIYKIPREEKQLIKIFGKEYITYKNETGGLLPKLK